MHPLYMSSIRSLLWERTLNERVLRHVHAGLIVDWQPGKEHKWAQSDVFGRQKKSCAGYSAQHIFWPVQYRIYNAGKSV